MFLKSGDGEEQEFESLENRQAEVRRFLSALDVPSNKIIRPVILEQNNQAKKYPDLIECIRRNYQREPNLVFGLSYSREGVCVKELSAPFFNCSCPGLDLYYKFLRV